MTNVAHAVGGRGQPEELDLVIVSPAGVQVVEIKHWDRAYLRSNALQVELEAERLVNKVRKVAGKVKAIVPDVGFVPGVLLLTKEPKALAKDELTVRGVRVLSLPDWQLLLGEGRAVPADAVDPICQALSPLSRVAMQGDLRRLGMIVDLELLSDPSDRFHRVYRGRHSVQQDRVFLHLYDLSASTAANAREVAAREFTVVQRLQKSRWLPRIVDSFQEAPGYPGELFYFSMATDEAPSLEKISASRAWSLEERIRFAERALGALLELHEPSDEATPSIVHRAITPANLLVRGGWPLLAGWEWAKLPNRETVSPAAPKHLTRFAAPEVISGGYAAADKRSDIYALAATLATAFEGLDDPRAHTATSVLLRGTATDVENRASLAALKAGVAELVDGASANAEGTEPPEAAVPEAAHWSEGLVLAVDDHQYRIVCHLGKGGTGRTFKVVQVDPVANEEYGTYVAKVFENAERGQSALRSYKLARSYSRHQQLAGIYSTAREWSPGRVLALLQWVEGCPLADLSGVLPLYAEDLGELDTESLCLGWLEALCGALASLHRAGLVHGDVSPRNIISSGADVTLTDYDLVTRVGDPAPGGGTPPYCAATALTGHAATPRHDIFALAATVFAVLTDRDPFLHDGVRSQDRGLAWHATERERYPRLAAFLDRAVRVAGPDAIPDGDSAIAILRGPSDASLASRSAASDGGPSVVSTQRTPNEVPWLKEILRAYPGSPQWGSTEARGLDSDFAMRTYVETALDDSLFQDIVNRTVSLVILCGNAGDGKTSTLQHLATRLGVPTTRSQERVWDVEASDGLVVRANLDGAASWKGKSADELLDEAFAPFLHGASSRSLAHLVAVNDGRLLEWVEGHQARHGVSRLTGQLADVLASDGTLDAHVRLVQLNARSLVGGRLGESGAYSTTLVDSLLERMVGGHEAGTTWQPCQTCSAQDRCVARKSASLLAVHGDPAMMARGRLLKERLTTALQTVHQRNEVHITARELKGALSYILFGVHYCSELHEYPDIVPMAVADMAFDPESPFRQGEVLRELAQLDPALESHPRIDRYLVSAGPLDAVHGAPRYPGATLRSARRRAYFEWTDQHNEAVGGGLEVVGLTKGRHARRFRDFPVLSRGDQANVLADLCRGISKLEELPAAAFGDADVVPLRVVARTPGETTFWVEKRLSQFALSAEVFEDQPGLETLHRQLILSYASDAGWKESLAIPLELFCLLLELSAGGQISDALSDDVFANLEIFIQRLAQEDERRLRAWNPVDDQQILEIGVRIVEGRQLIEATSVRL